MIEAMKQALEALTKYSDRVTEIRIKNDAIIYLRHAIAEAEKQEPERVGSFQRERSRQLGAKRIKLSNAFLHPPTTKA
jgi:hypothetical protein